MVNITDTEITVRIPSVKGKMVLLVEDPANPIPVPYDYFWDVFRQRLQKYHYDFLSLPELLSKIPPQIATYLFPGFVIPNGSVVCQTICKIAGIGDKRGLLYKKGRSTFFKDLTSPDINLEAAISEILEACHEESIFLFRESPEPEFSVDSDACLNSYELPEPTAKHRVARKIKLPKSSEPRFSVVSDIEEDLDPNTVSILAEVKRILKTYNLTLDELEVILGYTVKLSHMQITFNGDIFLTDFKDEFTGKPIEITKMDDLTKMIYLFYLKHPEGVRIKELESHIDELMHLYMKVSGRDDKDAIRARILNHVAPYSNNVNVCMSRIKSAFKNKVGEKVAAFYWIKGKSGEPYSIELDRDYVIWEY